MKVHREWKLHETWGWDFPMLAMCAARLGKPEMAVDYLLDYPAFDFDACGLVGGGRAPFPYFPGNGGLLYAVAMMAAGWDGAPSAMPPDFPRKDGWSNTRGCTRPSDRRMSHNLKLPMICVFYRLFFSSP